MTKVRICFVCLGNICRSPTAHGVMAHLVAQAGLDGKITLASAGTGDWHLGEAPDHRATREAKRHGVSLDHRAAHFDGRRFADYDYILAMDHTNRRDILALTDDPRAQAKVLLFRSFDPHVKDPGANDSRLNVPDPYDQAPEVYAEVFAICDRTCKALLSHLRHAHTL